MGDQQPKLKLITDISVHNLAMLIAREWLENNVIQNGAYLQWRDNRVEAIETILRDHVEDTPRTTKTGPPFDGDQAE